MMRIFVIVEKWDQEFLRLRSMLIVVAKAEGFATEEPLLAVVVAFSWTITDPVALGSAASEILGDRSNAIQLESFMAGTRRERNMR